MKCQQLFKWYQTYLIHQYRPWIKINQSTYEDEVPSSWNGGNMNGRSIIFHNMDHFPSNWEYCWAENNVQRTSLCRMLVDHFNAYHCYYNYAGCWFPSIPIQKCQTIKNWFVPLIKTSSLCFSEQLSNIINENRVVGYHIKSKSWSSLWTNSILKK